jgi:ubiquinone/menaquinone biosynthesis C-methylase UbiE
VSRATPEQHFDADAAAKLVSQMQADFAGALVSALAYIGDRLGLFGALADGVPRTSRQLAQRTGLNERYVREWASALAASGYLEYVPGAETFGFTPVQAAVLTDAQSPFYFAGSYLYAQACVRKIPALMSAFRDGSGIPFAEYGPEISEAIEKLFANGYRDSVATQWIPAVEGLVPRLARGASVAEVGCGGGAALIAVASAYPASRCVGYDLDETSLERARGRAIAAGVADRTTFERRRAEELPDGAEFGLVMAFNCIHDMTKPRAALRGIRRALAQDGTFLWAEARASGRLEENLGAQARMLYAASCMHCMAVALVDGGDGLGTVIGEETIRRMAEESGFASCTALLVEHPYHRVYALAV